jgi:hypothetical protein
MYEGRSLGSPGAAVAGAPRESISYSSSAASLPIAISTSSGSVPHALDRHQHLVGVGAAFLSYNRSERKGQGWGEKDRGLISQSWRAKLQN